MTGIHGSDYWGFGQGWNEDVTVGGLYHNGNLSSFDSWGTGNFLQLGGGEPASGYVNPGESRNCVCVGRVGWSASETHRTVGSLAVMGALLPK